MFFPAKPSMRAGLPCFDSKSDNKSKLMHCQDASLHSNGLVEKTNDFTILLSFGLGVLTFHVLIIFIVLHFFVARLKIYKQN